MTSRWILGTIVISAGCIHFPTIFEVTRARASSELRCPAEKIELTRRSDIYGPAIVDVEGCGKVARYAVVVGYAGSLSCIREPDPDAAALAAFRVASHPSTPP